MNKTINMSHRTKHWPLSKTKTKIKKYIYNNSKSKEILRIQKVKTA